MSVSQITTIDGNGIEWLNSLTDVTLRARTKGDAGKDLVNVFGPAAKAGDEIAFAIAFPWEGDRQETRKAVGTVTSVDEGSEFVTVNVRLTEAVQIQVTKRKW